MATRTRIISQNKAVYASQTGLLHPTSSERAAPNYKNNFTPPQLHRVDTFSFDVDLAGARQDIREFGQLSRIGTQTMNDLNPSLSFGYYLGDGTNETLLGLFSAGSKREGVYDEAPLTGSIVSGILAEDELYREKNIYVLTAKEGEDAFNTGIFKGNSASHDVVSFGNCVLTNYSANFSVGEIPRADVEMEASNIVFTTGHHSGLRNPAINELGARADSGMYSLEPPTTGSQFGDSSILVLRPDDVIVSFSENNISAGGDTDNAYSKSKVGGTHFGDIAVTSASIEIPLSRGNIEVLGKERAYAKPLEFPINVTMNMSCVLRNFSAGALEHVLTGTAGQNTTDITVEIKKDDGTLAQYYELKNCFLDNQSFSQGLDDNETVDLTFSTQIGGASNTNEGIFWSGSFANRKGEDITGDGGLLAPPDHSGDYYAAQPVSLGSHKLLAD